METATIMTFADKLKKLRAAKGWSQQDLADRSGVPVWTLRGLEQGRRKPSWPVLVSIARALGVGSGKFDDCDEVKPK